MNTLYTTYMIDQTRLFPKSLAFALAGFLFVYGLLNLTLLLIGSEIPPHANAFALTFTYVSTFIVNPLLMFLATRYPAAKLYALVWLNLTVGALIVWFSDIVSPYTALWSLLILVSSIYYRWRGFAASSLFLLAVALLYCLIYASELQPNVVVYVAQALMVVTMTVTTSYLFMRIITNALKKNHDLEVAQRSEKLQVNRLNTLLNSIGDAVLTLNRYGRITSQNAAAQAFFDTNQSLIGRDLETMLDLTDQADQKVKIHDLISSVKSTILRDDLSIGEGEDTMHLSIQMSRIKSTFDDVEEYGVVVIIRDITKQKSLEEEKDEFISVTSHELRTPVAIAEGSLSNLLVMHDKEADLDVLRKATKTAYDQVIYLAKIINDLSTLSRAERGVGDGVEDIDVNALLHNLYNRYLPEAEEKSLRLELDVDSNLPHIETSRLYLEEIMQNFITNALKYTKEGSITIKARLLDNGRITCSVVDTGIGINKHDQEHIFEKFYRSEDYRTRETSGTGLGLYVVQKLADKLETKIEVESRIDHGSTFSFVLPLKSVRGAAKQTPIVTASVAD
jgi:two-component system, OmpR family, phosphate regulon sensor histidine kinase PhoR